jgi:hypothetical protein
MSELPKNNNEGEDLFDFPQVEGFSPEFIEAARLQTEAANEAADEVAPSFDEREDDQESEEELGYDDFEEEFADNFSDLMGEPAALSSEEPVEDQPEEETVSAPAAKTGGFDLRFVGGFLAVLFVTNLLWAWTWHASEGRLRGEMDQRFQGYLLQQRSQLDEAVTALTPSDETAELARAPRPLTADLTTPDPSIAGLEEIKRDLMHSRHDTARAKAWRLIARVDALPKERRASAETAARLLIAESYEIQGTDTKENEG